MIYNDCHLCCVDVKVWVIHNESKIFFVVLEGIASFYLS